MNVYKPIPGNNEFLISSERVVIDPKGKTITLPSSKDSLVDIELYGQTVYVSLRWLSMLAHFEMYLPNPSVRKLFNVEYKVYKEDRPFGTSMDVLPIFRNPLQLVHDQEIYRIVPCYPKWAISKDGYILDTLNDKRTYDFLGPHLRLGDRGHVGEYLIQQLIQSAWKRKDGHNYLNKDVDKLKDKP